MTPHLKQLREATDNAISVIHTNRHRLAFQEAINWADLSCLQAAFVVTDQDEEYYEVTIEEAAPECPAFCAAVARELATAGWRDVHVVTEW